MTFWENMWSAYSGSMNKPSKKPAWSSRKQSKNTQISARKYKQGCALLCIRSRSPSKVNWIFRGTCHLHFQGRRISWTRERPDECCKKSKDLETEGSWKPICQFSLAVWQKHGTGSDLLVAILLPFLHAACSACRTLLLHFVHRLIFEHETEVTHHSKRRLSFNWMHCFRSQKTDQLITTSVRALMIYSVMRSMCDHKQVFSGFRFTQTVHVQCNPFPERTWPT
jgi:hypothetical protein